jgi:peptide/nickel transport system permease protein
MLAYVLRRLLSSALLIVALLTLLFFLLRVLPGDPVQLYTSPELDPGLEAQIRHRFGLDAPLPVQYLRWMQAFLLRGDFGVSFVSQKPVSELLRGAVPNTLLLAGLALVLRLVLGVALGILSAVRRGRLLDRVLTVGALVLHSIPSFWLGLMLILIFAMRLRWLPAGLMHGLDAQSLPFLARLRDGALHLVLPLAVLVLGGVAGTARYMRASLIEVLSQDYVRTARAKGLRESRVVLAHALRNALLPIVTLVGLSLPALLGGALVVETIFSWPGMGRLTVNAITSRDYPVILATTFLSAVLVVLGNLLSDLGYSWLDPRIRLGS